MKLVGFLVICFILCLGIGLITRQHKVQRNIPHEKESGFLLEAYVPNPTYPAWKAHTDSLHADFTLHQDWYFLWMDSTAMLDSNWIELKVDTSCLRLIRGSEYIRIKIVPSKP